MKAIVYDRYGGPEVLEERDVPSPRPGRGEVLIRVRAAALNPKDVLVRSGKFRWLTGTRFPLPFGHDWAGEVAETGHGDVPFAVGDRVYGCWNEARVRRGTLAQYAVSAVEACGLMPASLSFEEAASLPLAGQTALQALRDLAVVRAGDHLLVHGASGGVGTLAIQVGKALGAHVSTTSSAKNLAFCASLGADTTLDYATDAPFAPGAEHDVIFDVYGNLSFRKVRHALSLRGTYVTTVPSPRIAFDAARTLFTPQRARLVIIAPRQRDLATLTHWVDEKSLRPVVDRVFAWSEVREAARYLETRHARGKVVVRVP